MGTKKGLAVAAASAFAVAFIPALMALHMMTDNNNGELYNTVTGEWNVGYSFKMTAVFYVPSFLFVFALTFALTRLWSDRTDAP